MTLALPWAELGDPETPKYESDSENFRLYDSELGHSWFIYYTYT
jgi:hypothetical protein